MTAGRYVVATVVYGVFLLLFLFISNRSLEDNMAVGRE
jgi:hypothetical protein